MLEAIMKRLKRDKRAVSNAIVVMLSLVLVVIIVANVVLWSYQMNQLDWEKMKEDISITNVEHINRSSWFTTQSEYTVNEGSHISGSYTDTQAVDSQYERFTEALASPTYYPNGYGVLYGTYLSGTVPGSVQMVDSDYFIVRSTGTAPPTTAYNPSGYSLLGSTSLVSGTTGDLVSNNGVYMVSQSYASATSTQTLYAHQETTTIGGTPYYLQKLESADAAGTSLSASMAATGRQLLGKFVYPLTGVSSIPASTWTMCYRAWRDATPSIAFDVQSSMTQGTAATSISWSHTTGTGSNRLLLVAVGGHANTGTPTTVSSVTYDGVSLTQVTTALYSASDPQVRTYVFQLVNPSSGTKTITVNFAAATFSVAGATTYANVDQTTPIQTSNTATGSGTAPSVSVTVTGSGRWLFGHLGGHRTTSPTTWTITEGAGQTNRWTEEVKDHKGRGSDKSVSAGAQSMSWALSRQASYVASALVINPAIAVAHADVDIAIRQSDGTIRTTIAANVANSGDLTSTPTTLSGTYSWAVYPVMNQTDYLEIDYYVEVTTALSGLQAYLRIDDTTLAITDQTRATNIYLPSEYTTEVEFLGSSNTGTWTQLAWAIDSAWTAGSVSVTIQVYNYTLDGYPTSGNGYDSYTSSSTAETDETRTQTITTNPQHFSDGSGNWKIKVKGVKTTTTQFDFKDDWIEFRPTYYSEYTVSTEFTFSNMTTRIPTQLNFTVVSEYDIASVNVTIQVWDYYSSAYVTSGEGYIAYKSSGSNETKLLNININPQFYTSNGNAKIKITGVKSTTSQYQQKINQIELYYKIENTLDINGGYVIDLSTYPLAYIQTVEIQLGYRASDGGEKWYLQAYNWTAMAYSDIGFNLTIGHTPTTEWDYYVVNLTTAGHSYVHNNGTILVKLCDEGTDVNQTTIDIDFFGITVVIDGARFSLSNNGASTIHLVSIWIVNSTYHKRYGANFFINSGESATYTRADIPLPTENFVVKVVTERGNIAVLARH